MGVPKGIWERIVWTLQQAQRLGEEFYLDTAELQDVAGARLTEIDEAKELPRVTSQHDGLEQFSISAFGLLWSASEGAGIEDEAGLLLDQLHTRMPVLHEHLHQREAELFKLEQEREEAKAVIL